MRLLCNLHMLIFFGFLSGILAGLGMGGGTLLVPLLTLFAEVPQRTAQALNLLAFLPMSAVALSIHIKNKLVKWTPVLAVALPALVTSALASLLASSTPPDYLRKAFGVFLLVLGVTFFTLSCLREKPRF